jgi:hypothetical protein
MGLSLLQMGQPCYFKFNRMIMTVLENSEQWKQDFQQGWLEDLQRTGTEAWNTYNRPKNQDPVSGPGLDLSTSRLMLISTAGGYVAASRQPFDAANPLGDYSTRTFPPTLPFDQLAYAHEHYDHTAVNADPQVLLPLAHLRKMVSEGEIGGLTRVVSIMGYQPDVSRLIEETIPAILAIARQEGAQAALLVPA